MKKVSKIFMCLAILPLCMMIVLSGCDSHTHEWSEATCTSPKTCTVCGEKEGEPLGHSWQAATCTTPKTCSICGAVEGVAAHRWSEASCTEPKTCVLCGLTEGNALGHSGVGKCTNCYLDFFDAFSGYIRKNGEYDLADKKYRFKRIVPYDSENYYLHAYSYDALDETIYISCNVLDDNMNVTFGLTSSISKESSTLYWLVTYYHNNKSAAEMYGIVAASAITKDIETLPYEVYNSTLLHSSDAIKSLNKLAASLLKLALIYTDILLLEMPEGITLYNLGFTSY